MRRRGAKRTCPGSPSPGSHLESPESFVPLSPFPAPPWCHPPQPHPRCALAPSGCRPTLNHWCAPASPRCLPPPPPFGLRVNFVPSLPLMSPGAPRLPSISSHPLVHFGATGLQWYPSPLYELRLNLEDLSSTCTPSRPQGTCVQHQDGGAPFQVTGGNVSGHSLTLFPLPLPILSTRMDPRRAVAHTRPCSPCPRQRLPPPHLASVPL